MMNHHCPSSLRCLHQPCPQPPFRELLISAELSSTFPIQISFSEEVELVAVAAWPLAPRSLLLHDFSTCQQPMRVLEVFVVHSWAHRYHCQHLGRYRFRQQGRLSLSLSWMLRVRNCQSQSQLEARRLCRLFCSSHGCAPESTCR